MKTTKRIWRTDDGDLVLDGDLRAATLAYGADDDVENRDEAAVRKLLGDDEKKAPEPANKKAPEPANKKAPAPRSKGARRPAAGGDEK